MPTTCLSLPPLFESSAQICTSKDESLNIDLKWILSTSPKCIFKRTELQGKVQNMLVVNDQRTSQNKAQ